MNFQFSVEGWTVKEVLIIENWNFILRTVLRFLFMQRRLPADSAIFLPAQVRRQFRKKGGAFQDYTTRLQCPVITEVHCLTGALRKFLSIVRAEIHPSLSIISNGKTRMQKRIVNRGPIAMAIIVFLPIFPEHKNGYEVNFLELSEVPPTPFRKYTNCE